MTETEHLLDILIEECAEVIQRVTKAKRFGLHEVQPSQNLSNIERITQEMNDVVAVADMVLPSHWMSEEQLDAKREKVRQFLKYSQECGTLTDAPESEDKHAEKRQ